MDIFIEREYYTHGTNGNLSIDGVSICHTIELPNKDNKNKISCIPEGVYEVRKRTSEKHGKHLQIINVPNRDLILFHPANNAMLELMGCIAPVTTILGEGKGAKSKSAFMEVLLRAYSAIDKGEKVTLTIKKA